MTIKNNNKEVRLSIDLYTHTHTYIYIYIYIRKFGFLKLVNVHNDVMCYFLQI